MNVLSLLQTHYEFAIVQKSSFLFKINPKIFHLHHKIWTVSMRRKKERVDERKKERKGGFPPSFKSGSPRRSDRQFGGADRVEQTPPIEHLNSSGSESQFFIRVAELDDLIPTLRLSRGRRSPRVKENGNLNNKIVRTLFFNEFSLLIENIFEIIDN